AGSAVTKEKVRAAASELGYVPNRHAQAMRTGRGGGIVMALGTLDDPWGVQLTAKVREHALPHDLSTLVLADDRWFEYLMGASADAALITSIDFARRARSGCGASPPRPRPGSWPSARRWSPRTSTWSPRPRS